LFRNHGPKHLNDLHLLFDKVHITGVTASCPGDASSGESSDDVVQEVDELAEIKLASSKKPKPAPKKHKKMSSVVEEQEKSPVFRMYKNTCLKIESVADKITSSVQAPSQANLVPSIAQSMKMLKDCGVQENTSLIHTTSLLIMKSEFRELFECV
jgi:hypothetical protein